MVFWLRRGLTLGRSSLKPEVRQASSSRDDPCGPQNVRFRIESALQASPALFEEIGPISEIQHEVRPRDPPFLGPSLTPFGLFWKAPATPWLLGANDELGATVET